MKKFSMSIIFVFLFTVIFGFTSGPAMAKKVLLKVPICFSTALPGLGTSIVELADQLKLASGGDIVMKIYEPGKLVAPFEILDAVAAGKVNAGYYAAGYWEGKMPGISLFTAVPFGPEAPEFLAWMFRGNGLKLYQEYYKKKRVRCVGHAGLSACTGNRRLVQETDRICRRPKRSENAVFRPGRQDFRETGRFRQSAARW